MSRLWLIAFTDGWHSDRSGSGALGSIRIGVAARDALRQAKGALAKAEGVISQDSPTIYGLNEALTELTAALRSIRALADYLERHPEALIQGKNPSGGS